MGIYFGKRKGELKMLNTVYKFYKTNQRHKVKETNLVLLPIGEVLFKFLRAEALFFLVLELEINFVLASPKALLLEYAKDISRKLTPFIYG